MKVFKNKTAKKHVIDTYDQLLTLWNRNKQIEPLEEQDVQTSYGTTHVIRWGNKNNPPLVLFHGVGDNSALMWIYNAEALAKHFNIYAVDTIGGPGKSCPNENYNKQFDDIKWIDEILNYFDLQKVNITGVSNGAYLAQYYGIYRPERILKIACIAGSVPVGTGSPLKTMMKIFLPEALFPTKKNTIKLLKKLSGKNSHVFTDNPAVLEHYRFLLKGFNNMAMRFHNVSGFSEDQIKIIRPNTLYLMGDSDPFAKMGGKDALLKYNMNAQFFPDAGHGLNHEFSEEINHILIEYFLDV